jgi:hypothetical protein
LVTKAEVRNTHLKKFQVRQTHRAHLNKRINDNLRDMQLLERQHAKEKFELGILAFEEVGSMKISHQRNLAAMQLRHFNELSQEKESVTNKAEEKKLVKIIENNELELKTLADEQKFELKKVKRLFEEKLSMINIGLQLKPLLAPHLLLRTDP